MDSDTLLGLAIIVTGFLWEHRAGIVALLALALLGMIVNNIVALTQELHAVPRNARIHRQEAYGNGRY